MNPQDFVTLTHSVICPLLLSREGLCTMEFYTKVYGEYQNECESVGTIEEFDKWLVAQKYDSIFTQGVKSTKEKAERLRLFHAKEHSQGRPSSEDKLLVMRANFLRDHGLHSHVVDWSNLNDEILLAMMYDCIPWFDMSCINRWLTNYNLEPLCKCN